jgi:SnoaL-like domain
MPSMTDTAIPARAVSDLLACFFQAFDDRNWPMLRDCLCDEVFTDYSSFRGLPAATISRDRYVEQRRTALQALAMQHNFLNLRVEVDAGGETATARCNFIIHRFHPSFDGINGQYFHSYGRYVFQCDGAGGSWRIAGITQIVLGNHGNSEIHAGTRAEGSQARPGV